MPVAEAIILAGGLGTRLRPVVADLPKPLAPVAGRPFLAWVLDHLADNAIRHVVLATGYRAHAIEQAIGPRWCGMDISYSVEDRPLGTGGAIRQACGLLRGQAAHVLNGDTYLRYRLEGLEHATSQAGARVGMALAHVEDVGRYGAVRVDGPRVTAFLEKGGHGPGFINAGCYYLTRAAIESLPARQAFSFEQDVLVPMAEAGLVCAYPETAGFIDIGVPDDFLRAQHLLRR